MTHRIVVLGLALGVCIAVVAAPTASAQDVRYAYCYSARTTENTQFVSQLLQTSADEQALKASFLSYITEHHRYAPRYGYTGFLTCNSLPPAQAARVYENAVRNLAALVGAVTEVKWTGPAGSAAANSAPPLPTPPEPVRLPFEDMRWSCHTALEGAQIYVTPVWNGVAMPEEVYNAFEQELLTRYRYKGRVFCARAIPAASTMEKLRGDDERRDAQWRASGKRVVQTSWTFVPATVRLSYQCGGFARVQQGAQVSQTLYLSPILSVPGSQLFKLTPAWNAYLDSLHPGLFFNPAGCVLLPSDPATHQAFSDAQFGAWKPAAGVLRRVDWSFRQ